MKKGAILRDRVSAWGIVVTPFVIGLVLTPPLVSQVFAAVQFRASGIPARDIQSLVNLVGLAASRGAIAVVLPEHAIPAVSLSQAPGDSGSQLSLMAAAQAERRFQFLAKELTVWIALTIPRPTADGKILLTTLLFDGYGREVLRQAKLNPRPEYGDGLAEPGSLTEVLTADVAGTRIGVSSGNDLELAIPRLAQIGAKTVLVSASWRADAKTKWLPLAKRLAAQNGVNLVIGGLSAEGGDLSSSVISRSGVVLSRAASADDTVVLAAIPGNRTPLPPLGLPPDAFPPLDSKSTGAIALGQKLFSDGGLSRDGRTACAHCHDPQKGFADSRRTSEGVFGRQGHSNTPSLLNSSYRVFSSGDGSVSTLPEKIGHAFRDSQQMDMMSSDVVRYLQADPAYVQEFQEVYRGQPVTFDKVVESLTAYVQTLNAGDSPFDRFLFGGESEALSPSARRGFYLFVRKAGCAGCHTVGKDNALLSDNRLHNTGVGFHSSSEEAQEERRDVQQGGGRYLTPVLRNVATTAPYMHDGSIATLADVVEFYDRGGNPNPHLDPRIRPLGLTVSEREDLVEFLKNLTGKSPASSSPSPSRRSSVGAVIQLPRSTGKSVVQKSVVNQVVDCSNSKSALSWEGACVLN